MRLENRLTSVFVLVILLPVVLVMALYSASLNRQAVERFDEGQGQRLRQQSLLLSSIVQEITMLSSLTVDDQSVREALAQPAYDPVVYRQTRLSLERIASSVPYQLGSFSATLVSRNGYVYSTLPHSSFSAQAMLQSGWFADMRSSSGAYHWFVAGEPDERTGAPLSGRICLARSVVNPITLRVQGALLLTLAPEQLIESIGIGKNAGGGFALLDMEGRVIGASGDLDPSAIAEAYRAQGRRELCLARLGGRSVRLYSSYASFPGWTLVRAYPHDAAQMGLMPALARQIVTIALCAVAFCLLATGMIRRFLSPMRVIIATMQQVEAGDLHKRLVLDRDAAPELRELNARLSDMLDKVNTLMDANEQSRREAMEQERQKVEYRYNMLRSQVQPHFLFNTLNDIKWLALINGDMGAVEAIAALGRLLEASIDIRANLVPLSEEADNLDAYIRLVKLRYGDRVTFAVDLPQELRSAGVAAMMIQPLVENAVRHGLQPRGMGGRVEVRARREGDDLVLSVADDGVGFAPEQAKALLASSQQSTEHLSMIGLVGTHERIRYLFGEPYGISIRSGPDKGAEVSIRLPYRVHEQEEGA